MSLNRSEQMILDYVQLHVDERQFWQDKVRSIGKASASDHDAASEVEGELWQYFVERSRVVEPFKGCAQRDGLKRISMRNLAEYWLRMWMPPRTKKKRPEGQEAL